MTNGRRVPQGPDPLTVAVLASEVVPFAKTGGLADVAGALPLALERAGHRACVVLPCHRSAWLAGPIEPTGVTVSVPVGPQLLRGEVFRAWLPGGKCPAYLIDRPEYFDRPELYGESGQDYSDNCERFVFFARAALEALRLLDVRPDVIHCNDWQTGLVPTYLSEVERPRGRFLDAATVMTIHNLAYQGAFWHWDLPITGLPWRLFDWRRLEHFGRLNFLKAGLAEADKVTTVSPTYAREIQSAEHGCGLDGLLRARSEDLSGIVNGIDLEAWGPQTDPMLPTAFGPEDWPIGKAICKAALQRRASLPERLEVPLLAAIGRLDPQKGWDLMMPVLSDLIEHEDVQAIVLGSGHPRYQEDLVELSRLHPNKVRAFFRFDEALAHQIEAGADVFLMPSLYEPCGLTQMYSQRYGTVPIVRWTGGLADTVVPATPESLAEGTATGFAFSEAAPEALAEAVRRALAVRREPAAWRRIVNAGMARDFSWDQSAQSYLALYQSAIAARRGPGRDQFSEG